MLLIKCQLYKTKVRVREERDRTWRLNWSFRENEPPIRKVMIILAKHLSQVKWGLCPGCLRNTCSDVQVDQWSPKAFISCQIFKLLGAFQTTAAAKRQSTTSGFLCYQVNEAFRHCLPENTRKGTKLQEFLFKFCRKTKKHFQCLAKQINYKYLKMHTSS